MTQQTLNRIDANDVASCSPDLKAANLAYLKKLLPDAFRDGRLDIEVLQELLPGDVIERQEEKYGLNWHGKRRARQLALMPSTGTLRPSKNDSEAWESTQNLLIEGDNLEVLKLLQRSYAAKARLIYIDPPYNTGGDFVYPDDFHDSIRNYLIRTGQTAPDGRTNSSNTEASGRFHTDWLNMVYPRLKLARNLLREDGLICISIDEGELAHLRLVCDEIFGAENFFAILTRRAMHTVRNSSKDFNLNADYVLVYGKNKAWFGELPERYIRQHVDKTENYPFDDGDGRGRYKLDPLSARNFYTPYRHVFANGTEWEAPKGSYPRYAQSTLEAMEQENRIQFGNGDPKAKRYLAEVQEGQPPNVILAPEDVGFNLDGTRDLRDALGSDKVFSQPKPVKLVTYLLGLLRDPTCIVLDFFAGSGTAGHAVMQQNAADGGSRRFILVQLPEPLDPENSDQRVAAEYCDQIGKPRTITEITKQRLRGAANLIKDATPLFAGDLGFRVLKLDSSNIRVWEPASDDLDRSLLDAIEHIKPDRTEDDVLYELLIKLGLDLCVPIEQKQIARQAVHSIGAGALLVCLADEIAGEDVDALARGIISWHQCLAPAGESTVVFRDSAFGDDVAKTNIAAILQQHGLENIRSI